MPVDGCLISLDASAHAELASDDDGNPAILL
jgi:hypothetical protein